VYVLELAGQDDAFAVREAESVATGVDLVGAGLATARTVGDRARHLAFAHRASELAGTTDPSVESAATLLKAASLDRRGSVAVRAVDVRSTAGVDTRRAERVLGTALVDWGFEVDLEDPDHELRALFAGPPGSESVAGDGGDARGATAPADGDAVPAGVCALGWLAVETDRAFGERGPSDRPFFQPGSMDPILARALVNVAGARPGGVLLDPMCGTGGVLLEAGLVGARPVGVDAQSKMVRGTRRNLQAELQRDRYDVLRGDARRLPVDDGAVDAAVVDVPYGRQSKIAAESLSGLVGDALAELCRVAPRAVVVGDRSWAGLAEARGWTVDGTFRRRVHRSLDRFIVVLERE
jgi:tRNA (guanine10-N2)-dimethyltransferase